MRKNHIEEARAKYNNKFIDDPSSWSSLLFAEKEAISNLFLALYPKCQFICQT
ncbi:hypothetical protein MtrunA17_Chr1g0166571 [Medicago truncatula]|uniref:Uncharacterized protein n=1 Tax=Medicago truncatula TaxID=3880 RepID=I3SVY3_MEDTR|nr:unknown [Medicago truncatula]RHN78525.1 hypothetical protein MtrunA17_Chr1g0166571 [Medicago truncatula]